MSQFEKLTNLRKFSVDELTGEQADLLAERGRFCRLDAVLMTALANSGHIGGALSSMDIYNILLGVANLTPKNYDDPSRDRIIASHGHTSAGVYSALAEWGFFNRDEVIPNFRRAGSPYQGHVERNVPGVDWGTGNLGQGLSAGVGFALANRACGRKSKVFVVMGDGEQPKGQIAEARRIAAREKLFSLTAVIDYNHIQISGRIEDVMPVNIKAIWEADGWEVLECDGHDYRSLYGALKSADSSGVPCVILCNTVMGKGVSFMEGIEEYHGKPATGDLLVRAINELGGDPSEFERLRAFRSGPLPKEREVRFDSSSLDLGTPKVYAASDKKDNRGAFGAALAEVAEKNFGVAGRTPIVAFDCDLASSVKLDGFAKFAKKCPDRFIQAGIQEHATAAIAGAASTAGVVAVWADFGIFGIDEVYNQQRLNDLNRSQVKTVLTHVGLDVGEDGMTHQCVDYVSLVHSFFRGRIVVPADPNQTDRATRWMLGEPGSVFLAFGRAVLPVILKEDGTPFFGENYTYKYGEFDKIRSGSDATILAMGHMAGAALEAAKLLSEKGLSAQVLHASSPLGMNGDELIGLVGRGPLVTCEDHQADTGLGAIAALHFARAGHPVRLKNLGVTRYGDSGNAKEVIARMGLASSDIAKAVESLF
ncbi:MAG: transketolase [Synergistaceae bacterium]|jgi:transketolase|nr:transketolase [Synergistaceae bacterium]